LKKVSEKVSDPFLVLPEKESDTFRHPQKESDTFRHTFRRDPQNESDTFRRDPQNESDTFRRSQEVSDPFPQYMLKKVSDPFLVLPENESDTFHIYDPFLGQKVSVPFHL